MDARVAEIEKLRLDNKLGKFIRLLGDNEYTSIDFSTLRGEDCRTRTTPAEVTKLLEQNFDSWFSVPSNLDPAALAIEEDQTLYQKLVDPPPHIKEQMDKPNGVLPLIYPDSKISKALQAFQRKSTPQMEEDMSATLAPCTGILLRGIHCGYQTLIQRQGAWPVHGQLQHDQGMGYWDDGMIAYIHSMMQVLWEHKTIPISWKDHILSPLPKIPVHTELKNMRLISLFEIIRKIWTCVIVRGIQAVWMNHNILHSSQHGFRWG
jgi:hypothetical protein